MTELKPNELRPGAQGSDRVARSATSHRESADDYHSVIIRSDKYRVIICKDNHQWIIQRRAGVRHGTVRWDSLAYCRSRKTLLRLWPCLHGDGSGSWPKLECLPSTFGGS